MKIEYFQSTEIEALEKQLSGFASDSEIQGIQLLDIMMPEMDGFEVCRLIKKNPETEDIPIIFLTAKSETGEIVKGFQAGRDG